MSMGFRLEDIPVYYGDLSSFEDPSVKPPPPPYDENWVGGWGAKRKPAEEKPAEEKPAKRMPAKAAEAAKAAKAVATKVAKRKPAKRMPAKRMPAKRMPPSYPPKGMPVKKVSWETPDKMVELFEFIKSHPIQPADR